MPKTQTIDVQPSVTLTDSEKDSKLKSLESRTKELELALRIAHQHLQHKNAQVLELENRILQIQAMSEDAKK